MNAGHLSEYFSGIAAKRLSAVEADGVRSNQHEFNGTKALQEMFGPATAKQNHAARFVYLSDETDEPVTADGFLTWYDAREKHPKRSEHRLYFPTTPVSELAAEGDLLVIARRQDRSLLVIVARDGSTILNQVEWLFGISTAGIPDFASRPETEIDRRRIEFASRLILEQVGVVVESPSDTYLDEMLRRFRGMFPTTREFSAFARGTLPEVTPRNEPDAAIMAWMEREEVLFRTLERHIISEHLQRGFGDDVDAFLSYSLSVQNRRKSRVGHALENHLEQIFLNEGIRYSRAAVTEHKSRPDFLFPGIAEYRNPAWETGRLTMLGVKSTCKDRWRQVLAEADRIPDKHLLTLETAITRAQTDEMRAKQLQLVVPRALHATYSDAQRPQLMDVAGFASLVRTRQA